MREVRFSWRERLEMAAAWATPISLVGSAIAFRHVLAVLALVWGLAVAIFLLYDRTALSERWRRRSTALVSVLAVNGALAAAGYLAIAASLEWSIATLTVVWLLTFDFAGSSPTAPAGLFEEKDYRVVLDVDRCVGAYTCWAVCPEAVFEKQPERHQVEIARSDRCIRCGACLVQCPQDALAFEAPDGGRIGPEVIRRFKLNMLGRRAGAAARNG
jgi:NAD-dependent dihydropyrimidine dehydrogenase PreA subunit